MATIETEMTEIQPPSKEEHQQEETTQESDPEKQESIEEKKDKEETEESPPLTYVDFLPQCFGSRMEGVEPTYATFQTVMEQANQWLASTPQFMAVKCETVDYKVNTTDFSIDPDQCLQHFSSHGKNIYVKGLRLWLMPRPDVSEPVQQLAYVTVLPDHSSGDVTSALSSLQLSALRVNSTQALHEFDSLKITVDKLNHHLQQKPLPGRILTAETVVVKGSETDKTDKLDTENTQWTESGKASRLFLYAIRIFYVVGPPAFEKLSYYDQIPDTAQNTEPFDLRIKFAPFSQSVAQAAVWFSGQKNTRAVNFQSVSVKIDRQMGVGPFRIQPETPGYTESQGLQESRYVKILRIYYVTTPKNDAMTLNKSVHLTTRMFVPSKTPWTRSFETFSHTMQRVITWLKATGTPVLGMETVKYAVNPDSEAEVSSEKVDSVVKAYSGHFSLTCIRLYFPCEFSEPPPEVVAETDEDAWGWACVLS